MPKKIIMYTKTTCPYCVGAKQVFANQKVEYEEIDIDKQPEKKDEFLALAKKHNQFTVPMVFVDGEMIGGMEELVNFARNGGFKK